MPSPIKGVLKHFGVGDLIFRQKDVDNAINSITTAYVLHGYQRVIAGPAVLKWNADKSKVRINIPVVEGPQFTFSSLHIDTDLENSNINSATLKSCYKDIKLAGTAFHPRHLRQQIGAIRRALNDRGYLTASVDGNYHFDKGAFSVTAHIIIKPGPQFLFNDLVINGKTITRKGIFDYYTRRLERGKYIQYYRIEESVSYLYRTGIFESIRWKRVVKSDNNDGTVNADIVLDVKELPRNSVAFTVGYGSYEELRTGITYRNRNLFGIGLDGEIGYDLSLKSQRVESSLFIGEYYRKRFLILQTGWEEREEPSFDSEVFEAQIRYREIFKVGRDKTKKSEPFESIFGYNFELSEATNVAAGAQVESEGEIIVSSLQYALSYESRDDLFNPSRGARVRGEIEYATPDLGSDLEFFRYEGSINYYIPFGEQPDWVLAMHVRANTYNLLGNTDSLPIQKRLFLGGENSVRSFKRHELGPTNASGDPLGGLSSALASIEARFPLFPSYNLSGAIFWDAGLVDENEEEFNADIGQGIGFGIRFDLPIGPIRLDVAKNIDEEFANDDDFVVHFSLGFSF